jgi:uncharacterized protein YceK
MKILIVVLVAVLLSGCGTLSGIERRVHGKASPYVATKNEVETAAENMNDNFWFYSTAPIGLIQCVDLPVTVGFETVMLPLDFTVFQLTNKLW